jgi:hypothetical protein
MSDRYATYRDACRQSIFPSPPSSFVRPSRGVSSISGNQSIVERTGCYSINVYSDEMLKRFPICSHDQSHYAKNATGEEDQYVQQMARIE